MLLIAPLVLGGIWVTTNLVSYLIIYLLARFS